MKQYAHLDRNQMSAGMIRLVTLKNFLDIACLVLREQAELDNNDIMIFLTEMDNAIGDFVADKERTLERIDKMRRETGITTKIVGTHIIAIDETELE